MSLVDSLRFPQELKSAKEFPLLFLCAGEEETLLQECLKAIQTQFAARYGALSPDFNFEIWYGGKNEPQKVVEACQTLPFGSDRKLVVLKSFEEYKEGDKKIFLEYCQNPNPATSLVILWNVKLSQAMQRHELMKIAAAQGFAVRCWKPYESDALIWIKAELAKSGKTIEPSAARLLYQEGGQSLAELKSEIEKLVLFAGAKKEIGAADVKATLSFRPDRSIWDFTNHLEKGDVKKAAQVLEHCLEQGEEPVLLLFLMARSLRNSPGRVPPEKMAELFSELKQSDLFLKSGIGIESAGFERILSQI